MELRPIQTEQDALAVLAIYQSNPEYFAWLGTPNPTLEDIEHDKTIRPPGMLPHQKLYRLINDGEGMIDLILDYPQEKAAHIGLFMVHGRLIGQGRGREWIKSIETMLKDRGYRKIFLSVLDVNQKALQFWESLGFVPLEHVTTTVNNTQHTAVRMEKKLVPPRRDRLK